MELSELTKYAEEKFHIHEQHKWAGFPGFSVLADPNTGKWAALLMRQWDADTGTEIQRCDIKCGQQTLSELPEPYLSPPFRMKGQKWVGVVFDDSTEPEVVFRLFDRAIYSGEQRGYTIVLQDAPVQQTVVYGDTALPAAAQPLPVTAPKAPERIGQMIGMYVYGDGSFAQKCRNFRRQAKFMEDYEDNAPWTGEYRHYFPTYHDLNLRQLRGYFTWRTHIRRGEFLPIATSLAYIYLYELLNGVGTSSPADCLEKMQSFEAGFLDSGIGDPGMRKNLRRWMLEYAVLHDLPVETARQFADPSVLEQDAALYRLRSPDEVPDEALFAALCTLAGKKLEQSPVIKKEGPRGKQLFADVWRYAAREYAHNGRGLFTACFGARRTFPWHPLANAVYWEAHQHPDAAYALDECRIYRCRGGKWRESRYDPLYFDRTRLHTLLHEADRLLRKYLKTGHYLREKPGGTWAVPYVEAVIQRQREAEQEAARPEITIDLSGLEQIRQDARHTRDSLLTREEMDAAGEMEMPAEAPEPVMPDEPAPADGAPAALDAPHRQILAALLRGEPVETMMKTHHLMPSIVADTINEALFDEIGDNILTCDGDTLALVEEYREDILQILGGNSQ